MPMQGNLSISECASWRESAEPAFTYPFTSNSLLRKSWKGLCDPADRYRTPSTLGYRRISAELRRRGMQVNHKRVMRIMAEDNLLAVQPKCFVVTTNSDHEFEVYLNLASRMKLTGINQLWVADITYIRLQREFVFLAVILDAFSRKVVGMAVGSHVSGSVAAHGA